MALQSARYAAVCSVVGILCIAGGCQGAASLLSVISGPDVVPARYVLPDEDTAVLVDDPQNHLDNPSLSRQIGTTAVYHLRLTEEALPEAEFIEPREVARLERRLARDWATTPIDEIGRQLGADQVIYAKVVSASGQIEGNLVRPTATVEVKVVRSEDGARLWPASRGLVDPAAPPGPGYRFTVEMKYQTREGSIGHRDTPHDLQRQLADELGLELARIFYPWKRPEPGESL
ncbi:MAG: hypothetical protein AAF333_08490 [Planctomycetota bacterium]